MIRRSGVGFVGFRTDRFDEMVALFRDRIGLEVIRQAPGATWFRVGTDAELHVYSEWMTSTPHERRSRPTASRCSPR